MRTIGISMAIVGLALAPAGAARAQSPYSYPWCENYLGSKSGGTSCYFTSYEQCMLSARGNGAYCSPNPAYQPGYGRPDPYAAGPTRHHSRHRHHYYY
jgi:hypothetical protein